MNSETHKRERFWHDFARNGRFILLVALMAILLVSSATRIPIVFGHAAGKTYQAWAPTPPTINGEIVDSEWQTAASATFTMTIAGNPYSGTFYVMNDATNLYVAVKISDATFDSDDAVAVYFDNGNDGTFGPGDDSILQYAGAPGFVDRFLEVFPTPKADTDAGGTTDGSGAAAAHGGFNHFELSHPLDSADNAHDFSLGLGATVGFTLAYRQHSAGLDYWPAAATEDTTTWGDIVVASAPPTMTAWTDTAPTIDGIVGGSEWAGASQTPFAIGWTYTGEVWVMNDASNLYMAVKIADSSLTASDMLWVSFDNNNDGSFVAGDDLIAVYGNSHFYDAFWAPGPPATLDTSAGGTSDGEGASSGSGGFNFFEFSHPLDSGDNTHDFSLSAGDTVGFSLQYIEASGYWADWPSHNAKSWAHITIASAPVPTPDFTIAWSVPSLSVPQGDSGSTPCTVTSLNAFSAAVDLSGSWVGMAPTDVTFSLATPVTPPADLTATSMLEVAAEPTASTGTFTFRIVGASGALSHTADLQIEITAATADFTVSANPSSLSLGPGGSGPSTIEVNSLGIFSAPVTLTSSGAPSGLNLAFGTNPVTPPAGGMASSVLIVSVAGAAAGSYPITVTGTSDATTRHATLTVQVTSGGGGGCLIATATYGSELAPEVQFLRSFRDGSILRTSTGSSFMIAFNAWYYSFSPTVAQFIREHSTIQTAVKFMLYPLMGILRIGAAAFHLFPTNAEASAVISGLVVSSLIGIVYLTLPLVTMLAYSSRARRMAARLQLPTLSVLLSALALVALTASVGGPVLLMMLATSAVVLAGLTLSALSASCMIVRIVKAV
jgi:hypothetical protein